jgi:hypothetical protein
MQKVYGALLLAAVGGFIWDRMSSGPAAVEANASPDLVVPRDANSASGGIKAAPADVLGRSAWRQRLALLASNECLDPSSVPDAFEASEAWANGKIANPAPAPSTQPDSKVNAELAAAFRKHRLDVVMVGARGYANVDGQGIFVGEMLDGFTLMQVTQKTAVFSRENLRVELRLPTDATLKHRGSIIENASPKSGNGGR